MSQGKRVAYVVGVERHEEARLQVSGEVGVVMVKSMDYLFCLRHMGWSIV